MGPLRMRQAMIFQVVNTIPKCCNIRTPVKGVMCQNNLHWWDSDVCAVLTSLRLGDQWKRIWTGDAQRPHLHCTHFWHFKFPFFQKIYSVILWTSCQPLVCDWDAAKMLLDPFHPFIQSDLFHLDAWAYFLEAKQSTGWEFLFKRPLPIRAGIEMCDAAAGPRSPSQIWDVQCSLDTKEKMQELSSQFIKSLLSQINSSASMIDVNQILIREQRINMVAGFTLHSYSVLLFLKKFGFKGHKIAVDFRLVLGSELGLAVGIIGLPLCNLTIKLESLIL